MTCWIWALGGPSTYPFCTSLSIFGLLSLPCISSYISLFRCLLFDKSENCFRKKYFFLKNSPVNLFFKQIPKKNFYCCKHLKFLFFSKSCRFFLCSAKSMANDFIFSKFIGLEFNICITDLLFIFNRSSREFVAEPEKCVSINQ